MARTDEKTFAAGLGSARFAQQAGGPTEHTGASSGKKASKHVMRVGKANTRVRKGSTMFAGGAATRRCCAVPNVFYNRLRDSCREGDHVHTRARSHDHSRDCNRDL